MFSCQNMDSGTYFYESGLKMSGALCCPDSWLLLSIRAHATKMGNQFFAKKQTALHQLMK